MIQATTAIGAFMTILLTSALWIAAEIAAAAFVTLGVVGGGWAMWKRRH